ncbi:putative endonuclease [Pustulibacterium marinum]|uniref:Putative endonuclease n=2 Tax=Pustulibacterium marinum TaxID=1224947 RepID=A0A1I7ESP4_9FLAO|nr:putative endonuclease [Pustulibacterium marinum]
MCYVYIVSDDLRTKFLTGITDDCKALDLASKRKFKHLIYFETFRNLKHAMKREKELKRWKLGWKLALIKRMNPKLKSLL